MDNILYIGPYREFSGMGNAARQYIKALIRAGYNVSVRPIYNLFKPYPIEDIDNEIVELESNFSKSYHAVVQHCFPHQFTLDKRFDHNIGVVHLESQGYGYGIADYIDLMDSIIVPSNYVYKTLAYAGIDAKKIHVIPEPIDLDYISQYKQDKTNKKVFSFYTICDFIDRKNLDKIITAYSLAFDKEDPVELIIKLKNFSSTDIHIGETIDYTLSKIYETLKRNHINKPKIVCGNTKYDGIMYLHNHNDCFINASSGESFGYATLEAMAFNNNLIVNDKIGSCEIVAENCGYITNVTQTTCLDRDRLYHQYNTIDNTWFTPELSSLISNMYRATGETDSDKQHRILAQNQWLQNFSIDNISQQLLFI